ncbi:RF-1 domain-containing protein [Truncatella angustata]|uniref:RF-1 domain-containing protein n=1 Tax=Truncatella angustata TaxID=152316 RepID=A0A9P8UHI3_9PEZI|nr:RF-1 domain-containing protein [Truncatella angustata]KAH6652213.1 RF-1 domain-containing protein [Truncatella angustata]KAH8196680.1 hypothetical protein TruAng_009148 [Truncatella angustata]
MSRLLLPRCLSSSSPWRHAASFTTLSHLSKKAPNMPPRPKPPPDAELHESFLKGSGPGGQKINKTSSAVQLKHIPTGLVVKCQATRSRTENRKIARQLLADKLDDMSRGDESRSSVVGAAKRKKRASAAKKKRRKYRKLDEDGKEVAAGEGEEEDEFEDEFQDEIDEKDGATPTAQDFTEIPGPKEKEKT